MFFKEKAFSSSHIIMAGFGGMILFGTILLMLPISSQDGTVTGFLDALFTATSATCVTGLIVFDTATHWSMFGQFVILLLIQVGGMGVVTMAIAIVICTGRRIGLKHRCLMQESIAAPQVGGVVRLTGFIFRTTILIESIGAILLSFVFCPQNGFFLKGIWYSVFHSISAFCNAGFDLMGVRDTVFFIGKLCRPYTHKHCHHQFDYCWWHRLFRLGRYSHTYMAFSRISPAYKIGFDLPTCLLLLLPFLLFWGLEFGNDVWEFLL